MLLNRSPLCKNPSVAPVTSQPHHLLLTSSLLFELYWLGVTTHCYTNIPRHDAASRALHLLKFFLKCFSSRISRPVLSTPSLHSTVNSSCRLLSPPYFNLIPVTLYFPLQLNLNTSLFNICFVHSVQFSHSVVSDSLRPHESQHARPPCPSQTPGVHPNPCPLSWWCHPTILSSVVPFSSFPQSFSASGSFQMSQLFTWGGQSIGVSASASALPMNTQDWSPLGWTGWVSLQSKGLSRVFSNNTVQKHQFFGAQLSS